MADNDETTPLNPPGVQRQSRSAEPAGVHRRRVVGGRYVLRGLLGQGGMADVELAHDETLDRQVAIKILHARYADDPSFLARFRREAQAAANLNHPNIVGVYDFGEEDGRPYIVMEYVSGRSLREVLRREPILPERAAEIAGDAALALHYAHERGLVHRDIKPANILISDEGTVKVADFGIARAVNAETVTQTAAVFGTAAYVAPEQAQGEQVDRRTDVYALGCVLYEMLAGRQPFAGDSAVAVAYKHVSEQPQPPRRVNPEVPPELEAVVLRAMAKQPGERYATAREFNADLQRALQGLPVAPPPVAAYAATRVVDRPADQTLVAPPLERETYYYEDSEPRRNRTFGYVVLAVMVLLAFVVGAYVLASLLGGEETNLVQVPDVTGLQIVQAQSTLQNAGFRVEPVAEENAEVPENEVFATDPAPLANAPEGSVVRVVYSSGAPLAVVPRVEGLSVEDAREELLDAGFEVGPPIEEPSQDYDAGIVIGSQPEEGSELPQGSPVQLVVSTGLPTFTLPDLTNLTVEDATELLEERCPAGQPRPCLEVETEEEFSDEVPEGRVISQDPPPNSEVTSGETVTLVVSLGPEETETPTPTPTQTRSPSPSPTFLPPPIPTPTPTPTPSPTPTPTPTTT